MNIRGPIVSAQLVVAGKVFQLEPATIAETLGQMLQVLIKSKRDPAATEIQLVINGKEKLSGASELAGLISVGEALGGAEDDPADEYYALLDDPLILEALKYNSIKERQSASPQRLIYLSQYISELKAAEPDKYKAVVLWY